MTPLRRLGSRYPCCGDRCRYVLEVGVEREVACPRCLRVYAAVLVRAEAHAERMAGVPAGRVVLTPVPTKARA